ncbi:hypothetical protein PU560_11270 [Georgenia sp. 10Sc9-8]|uniref:Uncharacterized protein n=1 Tax=Georgenia halotolerans TaxID=3028317 RepID=A0ABT5TYK6_9MICO|nr:hypothetical protein [Georgenia halotolerans]
MQLTSSRARLSTDDLDALATSLSRQVLAGEIAEPAARMAIYEAVFKTDLVRSETLRWCHKHGIAAFQHEEMVEAADDFYTRKILDLPSEHQLTEAGDEANGLDSTGRNGRKFFELGAFADGASAAGSIRQALSDYTLMGRTLLRSVNRTRRGGQVITSTDLLEGSIEADNPLAHLVHEIPAAADAAVAHVIDAGRSDRLDHLYDAHRQAVSGKRGAMRTQIDASTVRATFDLPELERPLDPEVRTRMLRWLEEDTTVALRSVTAFFVPDSDDRAAAMGQLWADFTDEHLEAITAQHYGPQIAELLVREALADHARPGRPV